MHDPEAIVFFSLPSMGSWLGPCLLSKQQTKFQLVACTQPQKYCALSKTIGSCWWQILESTQEENGLWCLCQRSNVACCQRSLTTKWSRSFQSLSTGQRQGPWGTWDSGQKTSCALSPGEGIARSLTRRRGLRGQRWYGLLHEGMLDTLSNGQVPHGQGTFQTANFKQANLLISYSA